MDSNGYFCTLNLPPAETNDMGEGQKLPPYAPIAKYLVDDYECPSNWIKSEGTMASYFCPVIEGRGLWLDFNKNFNNAYDVAILISVQGINPITGMKYEEKLEQYSETCPKCNEKFGANRYCETCGYKWPKQNYLCTTGTPDGRLWIDGFRTIEGVVRQYIITEEKAKGVAANIIGENRVYAIGITFFHSKEPKAKKSNSLGSDYNTGHNAKQKTFNPLLFANNLCRITDNENEYFASESIDLKSIEELKFSRGELKSSKQRKNTNIQTTNLEKSFEDLRSGPDPRIVRTKPQFFSPVHTPINWKITDKKAEVKKNTKKINLEVGVGKQIKQEVYDDPMKINYWNTEPDGRICVNYIHADLADNIIARKKEKTAINREGFLKDIPLAI